MKAPFAGDAAGVSPVNFATTLPEVRILSRHCNKIPVAGAAGGALSGTDLWAVLSRKEQQPGVSASQDQIPALSLVGYMPPL